MEGVNQKKAYQYVVIGNSAAAIGTIEGIRKTDPEGKIAVVSSEPYHTYSRPLISYLLEGKTDRTRMLYRDSGFYERNGCDTYLGKTAVSIDPAAHTVTLRTPESAGYPVDWHIQS